MNEKEFEVLLEDYLPEEKKSGDVVEGVITRKELDFGFLDLNAKKEGRIYASEVKDFEIGDKIEVKVLREDEDNIIVSKFLLDKAKELASFNVDDIVTGEIIKKIKGGYTVRIGKNEAFLPFSLARFDKNKDYTGQKFKFLIKEKNKSNITISRSDLIKIEEEKKEIEKNLNQIQVLRKLLENDVTDKLKHEKEKIEEARNEAKQILIDAKEEANEIISKLSKMQQSDIKKAEHLRNKLNDSVNNSKAKGLDLSVLLSLNNKAPETLAQSSKTNSKVNIKNNKAQTIKSEINVIGETVAVATEIIDQYLDSCYMAGLKECRIIHGKGTGKLRQGIHEFLKKLRYVDNYYTAGFTDGDIGATIVKLKSKH